jgi:hypothetical protein
MRVTVFTLLLAACGGGDGPTKPPAWEKDLPEARVIGERWGARGLTAARGIVHLHSPYSHDACDGKPRDETTNAPNEPCLADLRAALCKMRIDFAALTDHDDTMADEQFQTLYSMRGTDQPVMNGADQIASRILCDNGHQVLVSVGGENDLMPIMLDRHVPGDVAQRHATYNGNDAAAAAAFRAAGGLVWVAHTESKTLETLRAVQPHGIEVYNLHANIDPDIRKDYLGLPSAGALTAAAEFADNNPGHPEPDLAMIAFLSPNEPAISKWNTLLGEGMKIAATAGSDAHQNAIPVPFADGERGDSYRRVMRWFGNFAIVADHQDPAQIEMALATGRIFTLHEVLGTPVGFDVRATMDASTFEIGAVVPRNARLVIDVPTVRNVDPKLPAPVIRTRALWIEPGGQVTELASKETANVADQINLNLGAPGAYRIEISMIPRHLGPYLGDLGPDLANVEMPWIYVSPFYVE